MFITDLRVEPAAASAPDEADIIELSRPGSPYFASVLESNRVKVLKKMDQCVLDDPGQRGISHLYQEQDFVRAVLSLSHASRVAVTTGFPVHTELAVREETDGLPGALSICQALLALGKEVVLVSDRTNIELFTSCVDHMTSLGALRAPVRVMPCSEALEAWQEGAGQLDRPPPWDCLVAIERAGRAKDGTHHTMRGLPISVDPVDDLFVLAATHPLVTTIAVGDGGNELGMGKVYEAVVRHVPLGDVIACEVAADFLIAAGVSNWAGYALSLGLYLTSSSPAHHRYRNRGIGADHAPKSVLQDFLPSNDQV